MNWAGWCRSRIQSRHCCVTHHGWQRSNEGQNGSGRIQILDHALKFVQKLSICVLLELTTLQPLMQVNMHLFWQSFESADTAYTTFLYTHYLLKTWFLAHDFIDTSKDWPLEHCPHRFDRQQIFVVSNHSCKHSLHHKGYRNARSSWAPSWAHSCVHSTNLCKQLLNKIHHQDQSVWSRYNVFNSMLDSAWCV